MRCVEWMPERGLLATGSWDRTVNCWDPRIPQASSQFMSIDVHIGSRHLKPSTPLQSHHSGMHFIGRAALPAGAIRQGCIPVACVGRKTKHPQRSIGSKQSILACNQAAAECAGRHIADSYQFMCVFRTVCLNVQGSNRAAQMRLPGKVFSMSCAGQRLVVATSSRHVLIYDIRM